MREPNRRRPSHRTIDLAQWDDALAAAIASDTSDIGGWVAQRYVDVRTEDFPMLAADGSVSLEEMYVVCGFMATDAGVGILGRASKHRVVNVGQKGGPTTILVEP